MALPKFSECPLCGQSIKHTVTIIVGEVRTFAFEHREINLQDCRVDLPFSTFMRYPADLSSGDLWRDIRDAADKLRGAKSLPARELPSSAPRLRSRSRSSR